MNDPKSLETVLYEFAVESKHDRATLERYLKKYPDFVEELIDLSFELRITEVESTTESISESDPGLDKAWEEFIGFNPEASQSSAVENVFGKFKGQAFIELAATLKVPRSILTALRDRLVEPTTVPEKFLVRLAKSTDSNVPRLRQYLSMSPALLRSAQFKADRKPSPQGRVSFQELVASTEMTDEERKVLLED